MLPDLIASQWRWNIWAVAANPLTITLLDHDDRRVANVVRDPVQRHHFSNESSWLMNGCRHWLGPR
ncbi:hypothetical protein FRY77_11885 [Halomonas sp. MG34]|nr:hypothetical protein [Halomonas sp. MG34]